MLLEFSSERSLKTVLKLSSIYLLPRYCDGFQRWKVWLGKSVVTRTRVNSCYSASGLLAVVVGELILRSGHCVWFCLKLNHSIPIQAENPSFHCVSVGYAFLAGNCLWVIGFHVVLDMIWLKTQKRRMFLVHFFRCHVYRVTAWIQVKDYDDWFGCYICVHKWFLVNTIIYKSVRF